MKKMILFSAIIVALSACQDLSQYATADSNASAKTRMRACMVNEANIKLTNGTLFNLSIKETASEITNTCLRKLALQAVGISEESQNTAMTIISGLQSMAN